MGWDSLFLLANYWAIACWIALVFLPRGPRTLALMHGPSFTGDGAAALHALADDYDRRASGRGIAVAA